MCRQSSLYPTFIGEEYRFRAPPLTIISTRRRLEKAHIFLEPGRTHLTGCLLTAAATLTGH